MFAAIALGTAFGKYACSFPITLQIAAARLLKSAWRWTLNRTPFLLSTITLAVTLQGELPTVMYFQNAAVKNEGRW